MRRAQTVAAIGGLLMAAGSLAWLLARGLKLPGGLGGPEFVLLAAVGCGFGAIGVALLTMRRQHRRLERLRGGVLIAGGLGTPLPRPASGAPDEIDKLQQAVGELIGRERDRRGLLDRRLERVLGAIDDAIVVVTAQGQVSLLNAAGKELLGGGFGLGASLFELFERESLSHALMQADGTDAPHRASLRAVDGREIMAGIAGLGPGGGALLRFAGGAAGGERLLEHDLALHDQPPEALPPDEDTPLAELPAISIDTETTGLDVRRDRLISVAGVLLHGERMFPAVTFDRLVNPGRRIPPVSTSIHGITDAMVADAVGFPTIAGDLAGFCGGRVWIGHNIGFDVAILRREARLAGLAWKDPTFLDTLRLYAALRPRAPDVELDAVAVDLGVDVSGRHTALGDALMTAEVYRRLLPLLAEQGVKTLGEALAFAERPHMIRRLQQALGW
jgi:DNA polymerase-3 subunit epsilon